MSKSEKTKEFIAKAVKIHGDRYDYSRVVYENNKTKVVITCRTHGDFKQRPDAHLYQTQGCPICGGSCSYTTEEFVAKAAKIHSNQYDYPKMEYRNNKTKIIITCRIHGDFKQKPDNHLSGNGCPRCGSNYNPTTQEWKRKAVKIHGNRYDYSKVVYENNKTKVVITCRTHGDFKQKPDNHLARHGCSRCQESKGEKKIHDYLISRNIKFISQFRVGNCRYFFDFLIPGTNTLVEYDGEQHFDPDNYYNRKKDGSFERRKIMDLDKTEIAITNGYKLVRIPYTSYNEIETILDTILDEPRNLIVESTNDQVNEIYWEHNLLIEELECK